MPNWPYRHHTSCPASLYWACIGTRGILIVSPSYMYTQRGEASFHWTHFFGSLCPNGDCFWEFMYLDKWNVYWFRKHGPILLVVVSKISIRINMYRYFQKIDPFFDIFKISIQIDIFWGNVGNTLCKFLDILKGNFVTFCVNFWKNLWKIIRKTWNYYEKILK